MTFRTLILATTAIAVLSAADPASLSGTIEDQTGSRIAGAHVAIRNLQTGQKLELVTEPGGEFRFPSLPAARYELQAAYPGFNAFHQAVELRSEPVSLVIQISAATINEEIHVSAATDLLQPNRATNSVTLTADQITSLPTASRNYTHLIVSEAGVSAPLPDRTGKGMNLATSPGGQGDDGSQSLNPSVNGARPTNNSVSLNGVDTTNMMNANGSLGNNVSVPLDALEVVEMQTALYSASTGRNGGGNIQMVTRSGANAFHGSAYHFLQNEVFNANEFFLNRAGTPLPKFRRNETGVTFGGRIIRDKTFFFASVQRTDFTSGYANRAIATTGVPDGLTDVRTRESIADVSNKWIQSGARDNPKFAANLLQAIRAFPAEQIGFLENKFFENVNTLQLRRLLPSDIHPVAINVLNVKRFGKFLLPSASDSLPLIPGNGTYGAERSLTQVFPTIFNSWSGLGTIEHNFTSSHRLRLNYVRSQQYVEEAFPWANSSPSPTLGLTPSWTASLSDVRTFGPHWVNDLRGGFFELFNTRISKYRDILNSTLGIHNPLEAAVGGLASLMPTIDIVTQRSGAGIGNAWDFYDRQRVINAADTVSYTTSRHTFQFGGEVRRPTIKGEYMARTNGDLDYDNWLFFFTGHGASGGGSDLDQGDTRRHFKMRDASLFIQDDWRIRPGLTLNLGVRWDFFGNPVDPDGKVGNYYNRETAARLGLEPGFYLPSNSAFFKPNFNPRALGLVISPGTPVSYAQIHKSPYDSTLQSDYNNFAPRIGFAWQPRRFRSLVIRGGYGIFYERTSGAFKSDLQLSAPYFFYANVPAPVDMADPYPRLNVNPFQIPLNVTVIRNAQGTPSFRRADGSPFPNTEPYSAKSNTFIDPFVRTPYVQQWSFNVQYEPWRGNLLDVRYVGSRGVGLLAKLNLAQPQDPRVVPVNGFNDIYNASGQVINPDFFVKPEYLGLSKSGGFRYRSNWGQSAYHGLQATFRRKLAGWFMGNIGYTWSKSLDNVSSDSAVIEHDGFNLANNRGLSNFDRTHRFTAAYIITLPNLLRRDSSLKILANGWSLGGMATLQSGAPFSALGAATRNAIFAQPATARLDFAPGKTIAHAIGSGRVQDRLDNYFNVGAFTDSLDHWGNSGRNILRGPAQTQFDLTLSKQMRIRESLTGEFRWEAYNVFNTPVFANPANTFATNGAGTAGRITATIGGPRTMQAGFRVRW
jgi:outer membrane receptor protein involved in Fe transport